MLRSNCFTVEFQVFVGICRVDFPSQDIKIKPAKKGSKNILTVVLQEFPAEPHRPKA